MRAITKKTIKKFLDMVGDLQKGEDKEKYKTFWQKYGKNLKFGIVQDEVNKNKILKLCWFKTSKEKYKYVSL